MILDVYLFNQRRNQFAYDPKNEMEMLKEECKEFFDGQTTADRLDAYVDFLYVFMGTEMKAAHSATVVKEHTQHWVNSTIDLMESILQQEIGEQHYFEAVKSAKSIVCNANAIKGTDLNEKGKVVKSEEYKERIDATKQIALMLEDLLKPKAY